MTTSRNVKKLRCRCRWRGRWCTAKQEGDSLFVRGTFINQWKVVIELDRFRTNLIFSVLIDQLREWLILSKISVSFTVEFDFDLFDEARHLSERRNCSFVLSIPTGQWTELKTSENDRRSVRIDHSLCLCLSERRVETKEKRKMLNRSLIFICLSLLIEIEGAILKRNFPGKFSSKKKRSFAQRKVPFDFFFSLRLFDRRKWNDRLSRKTRSNQIESSLSSVDASFAKFDDLEISEWRNDWRRDEFLSKSEPNVCRSLVFRRKGRSNRWKWNLWSLSEFR